MKIQRMKATFGTLFQSELILSDGLNVIFAPNESGKSTWCAFIRAMLYGIDTAAREKGGVKPDKIKYMPWNGNPMEGYMDLLYDGKEITLRRYGSAGPMRLFSATYTGSKEKVSELTGKNAGEYLTGIPKSVFERSAFVSQAALAVHATPELEARIAAIVSTGEEDTSFSEVEKRLLLWQRARKSTGRRGKLYVLEDEIVRLERKHQEILDAEIEIEQCKAQLAAAKDQRDDLLKQVEESRKQHRKQALQRLSESQTALKQKQAALEHAQTLQKDAEQALYQSPLGFSDPTEYIEDAKKDILQAQKQKQEMQQQITMWPTLLCGILSLVLIALSFMQRLWILPGAALFIYSIFTYMRANNKKKVQQEAQKVYQQILQTYHVQCHEEIAQKVAQHQKLWKAYVEAKTEVQRQAEALQRLQVVQAEADATVLQTLDFSSGDTTSTQLTKGLQAAEQALQWAREQYAVARGRREPLGNAEDIEAALTEKQKEQDTAQKEYDAISLALTVMQEASTEIHTKFAPQLSRYASKIFHKLTGGSYDKLSIDGLLQAEATKTGDITPREAAYLSAGAIDQLYLALRLAICELALPQQEACPLILDDVLTNFDPQRIQHALEQLQEISEKRQVILFTSREIPGITQHLDGKV